MSIKIMAMVFDVEGHLSPTEKLIMLALADHANDEGKHVYPGTARLMKKSGLGETAVRSTLKKLGEKGVLLTVREATPTSTAERVIIVETLQKMVDNPLTVSRDDTGVSADDTGGVSGNDTGVSAGDTGGIGKRTGEGRQTIQGVSAGGPESSDNHHQPSVIISEPLAADGANSVIDPEASPVLLMTPAKAWEYACAQLRMEMRGGDYERWIGPMQFVGVEGDTFRLRAPDEKHQGWVQGRVGKRLERLLSPLLGCPVKVVVGGGGVHPAV